MCRFINADDTSNLAANSDYASYNLFAYCGNNPVSRADDEGKCWQGIVIGVPAIVGAVNNAINAIYYRYYSDGESDLTNDSYTKEKPSRWDKLDYVKEQTGDEHYFGNAWRYYSEYSLHEYGWYVTKSAIDDEDSYLGTVAKQFREADVLPHDWDPVGITNIFYVLWGVLGF